MRIKHLIAASGIILAAAEGQSQAGFVHVNFKLPVTSVPSTPIFGIDVDVGDEIIGEFVYDTDASDEWGIGDPTYGYYSAVSGWFEVNGVHVTGSPYIEVLDDPKRGDSVMFGLNDLTANGTLQPTGTLEFVFDGPPSLLSSDALPNAVLLSTVPWVLFDFDDRMTKGDGIESYGLPGEITITEVSAVPEPGSLTLLGLGSLGLAGLSRWRRKQAA